MIYFTEHQTGNDHVTDVAILQGVSLHSVHTFVMYIIIFLGFFLQWHMQRNKRSEIPTNIMLFSSIIPKVTMGRNLVNLFENNY